MEELIKILKEARLAKGLDIGELAKAISAPKDDVENLEAGAFSKFASEEKIIELLRKYGGYVGLDVNSLLDKYKTIKSVIDAKDMLTGDKSSLGGAFKSLFGKK